MILLIDYGVGNIASISNMLRTCGLSVVVSSKEADINAASHIILPGVGAYDAAARKLREYGLYQVLQDRAKAKIPLLGICLGAQLLLDGSEEGNLPGLGIIPGYCKKFDPLQVAPLKVPHMSWSEVNFVRESRLNDFGASPRFYFVHSYYFKCNHERNVTGVTHYGHSFPCVIEQENVFGVQFHPEKSHRFGKQLLTNFVKIGV